MNKNITLLLSMVMTLITAFIPTNPKKLPYYHWFSTKAMRYSILLLFWKNDS